jgi:outer membrane protein insertion porin family
LLRSIQIKEGDLYQSRIIRDAVASLYQTGKFKFAEVRVRPLSDKSLAVIFVLSERRIIADIRMARHPPFPEKELWDALGFTKGEGFDESEWNARMENLLSLYKRHGYFEVSVKSRFQKMENDSLKTAVFLDIQSGPRVRIKAISFTGHRVFSDLRLYLSVLSRPPEYFSAKRLEEDQERLRLFYKKRGYPMASIGPPRVDFVSESHVLQITMPIIASTEIDIFFPGLGRFEGPTSLLLRGNKSLSRFVRISKEHGDSIELLEASARAIEDYYRDKGYPFATVTVDVKSFPEKNRKEIHFTIQDAIRTRIRSIAFSGNRAFSEEKLMRQITLKKDGLFTRTRFTQERLQLDTERIASLYKQNGFQSVAIQPVTNFEKKRGVALTFQIEEGTQTLLNKIEVAGVNAATSIRFSDVLSLHPNDPYNKGVVREGARQILTVLSRLGYIDAKVDSDVTLSSDQTKADIQYRVDEGDAVVFGELHLFGNKKTDDAAILREIVIQKGDPYDYEKILKSQQRLNKMDLFSGIRFDPIRNPDHSAIQDMNLTVVEQPRLLLEVGPGYGEREGVRGFLEIGHRNLFGTGRKASGRAAVSQYERQYSLHYIEPRVTSYDVDITLKGSYFRIPRESFNEEALVGTIGGEMPFSSAWKGALLYQYEDKEISDLKPGVLLTAQDIGRLVIGSVNPSLIRDTRDNPFNPKTGSVLGITLRSAAKMLGSEVQMAKITQQGSLFFSPTKKATLALSVRTGIARRFGETQVIPLSERFFLGGRSTVRGYRYQKLGTEGETLVNSQPVGGNAMLVFNEEVRFDVGRSFGIILFFDHGNVWREVDEVALSALKSTTGAGIRYNTPVGPLRVDWGYKLDREAFESATEVHFTLGHAF